ncbi:rhodanese-related sulfurtransferase [Bradyrhizobium sp. GM7.3]
MKITTVTPADIRRALLLREEIALLDLRHEAGFATGHPLFAANMAADRIAIEAEVRLPRKNVPIVLYDDGEGLVTAGAERLAALGYTNVRALDGGLKGLARRGLSNVRGRQLLLQSLWRAGRVA